MQAIGTNNAAKRWIETLMQLQAKKKGDWTK